MEAGETPPLSEIGGVEMWTCIGLDPGGTTGWCVLRIHLIAMQSDEYRILDNIIGWSAGQVNGSINHQIDRLVDLVDAWPEAEVVCEDFILRQMSGGRDLLDPVRITQPVEWWLASGGRRAWDSEEGEDWKSRELHIQSPSLAMTTITDDRMKSFGLYSLTAGQPHARDALRHALTFARRRKQKMLLAAGIQRLEQHANQREGK